MEVYIPSMFKQFPLEKRFRAAIFFLNRSAKVDLAPHQVDSLNALKLQIMKGPLAENQETMQILEMEEKDSLISEWRALKRMGRHSAMENFVAALCEFEENWFKNATIMQAFMRENPHREVMQDALRTRQASKKALRAASPPPEKDESLQSSINSESIYKLNESIQLHMDKFRNEEAQVSKRILEE